MQDARILAARQNLEPDPDGKANAADVVTLLVTPQDAEKMALANSLGKIHFVLRNGSDHKEGTSRLPQLSLVGDTGTHAMGGSAHPRSQKTVQIPVAHYIVQTIAGSKQTEDTFEGQIQ